MTHPGTRSPPRLVGTRPQVAAYRFRGTVLGAAPKPRRANWCDPTDLAPGALLPSKLAGGGSRIGEFREAWPSSLIGGGCGARSMSVPSLSDGHAVIYVATTHVLREHHVPNFVAVRQHHDP